MKLGQLLRYSSSRDTTSEIVDGLSNYYHATLYPGRALPLLERGINPIARVKSPDGLRIPAVLIRSSPHKAGSTTAPWQDLFDTDNGKIRYFGDNRPEAQTGPELAPGNKLLNSLVGQLWAESTKVRLNATPLIFFRGAALAGRQKGQIEFHGYGLIEQAALVSQWDATSSSYFTNYVYDFLVFSLVHENEAFDWGWINTRRDPKASDLSSLAKAPAAWRRWAQEGPQSIPQIRRSVAKFRVVKKSEQLPSAGSKEDAVLQAIILFYKAKKVRFEALADWVVARVLGQGNAKYRQGWITRRSADGGADFVGRLDIGSAFATTRIVVFGQAKCESPRAPTNGNDIARTVARLRRGWIGVYVTTSFFSDPVQQEIIEDQYPIVLIHGKRVAEEVAIGMFERGLSVQDFLKEIDKTYETRILMRRPEEILLEQVFGTTPSARTKPEELV
jgi:Restriction endonuclease AspBHI N-terminal/Restriction endonuclease